VKHPSTLAPILLALFCAAPPASAQNDTGRSLSHEAVVSAPVAKVWAAFTDPEVIVQWMGVAKAEMDLALGGRFSTNYHPDEAIGDPNTIEHEILAFEPERMLTLRLVGCPPELDLEMLHQTWYVLRFEPLADGTTKVTGTGHGYGEGAEWDELYAFGEVGNAWTFQQLVKHFETGEGPDRTETKAMVDMFAGAGTADADTLAAAPIAIVSATQDATQDAAQATASDVLLPGLSQRKAVLGVFTDLVGGSWTATGQWRGGPAFEQTQTFEWGLEGNIVHVRTTGQLDAEGNVGPRSEGVRAWDASRSAFGFWEFDRFGGVTAGSCGVDDGVLWYQYEYTMGDSSRTMRDTWRKLGPDHYEFKVGLWGDGEWEQVLLDGECKRGRPAPDSTDESR